MLASLLVLADAAEEGRKVVLSMLVVGLIFVAVIALGELTHYLAREARSQKPRAPRHENAVACLRPAPSATQRVATER